MSRLMLLLSLVAAAPVQALEFDGREVSFEQVAVVVFSQNPAAKKFERSAQSRLENILLDNDITVLDQDKAKELKEVWKKLEDPGYFVTAEDFVTNAEGYEIDGLIRLYLNADSTTGLAGFHSATAQADLRFIDSEANVEAYTTVPMGVPGKPPSDGLTKNAAMVNAVQRAVDEAAGKTGLELIDRARPRTLRFALDGPVELGMQPILPEKPADKSFEAYAEVAKKQWSNEEITTSCLAPSGHLGAVGGYLRDTKMGMRRSYHSILHLVDTQEKRETGNFETTTKKKRGKRGRVKLLDCLFVSSWRYLAAVTGLELFLFDTERGKLMSSIRLDTGIKTARLAYTRHGGKDYLSVVAGDQVTHYSVGRKK